MSARFGPDTRASHMSIAAFFALTLLLLALVPLLSMVTGASMDFDAAARAATEETGIEMTSNLLVMARLVLAEPSLALILLGSAIPSLAALLVCAWTREPALLTLLARFRPVGVGVSLRQGVGSYALLLLALPLCLLAVFALRSLVGGPTPYTLSPQVLAPTLVVALLSAAFLDQGGLLEELGWRGYAQPALETRVSPLAAACTVGVAWGLWHVPRDVVGGVIERLGALVYLTLYLPAFLLGTITVSIIAAHFMRRTGGSVLAAVAVHGLANDAVGLSGGASIEIALTPYHQITRAVPFALYAVLLIAWYGPSLGHSLGALKPPEAVPPLAPR